VVERVTVTDFEALRTIAENAGGDAIL